MAGEGEKRMDLDKKLDGERRVDGEKKADCEKKPDGEKKVDGIKKPEAGASLEDKLAQLEKKFAELETKFTTLKGKAEPEDGDKDKDKDDDKKEKTDSKDADAKKDEEDKEKKPEEPVPRVRIVTSRVDEDGERRDHELDSEKKKDSGPRDVQYAITLRKNLDTPNDGEIEIFDSGLRELLRKLLAHYPYHYFVGEKMELYSPYEPLIFNWDLLQEEASREPEDDKDRRARGDLRELLDAIRGGSGDAKLDSYLKARNDLVKQKSITFEALWTIFPPGTVIYGQIFLKHDVQQDQIFIVEDNRRTWPKEDESRRSGTAYKWKLRCWTYDMNVTGKVFQRRSLELGVEAFEGPKPITSLPFYPISIIDPERYEEIEKRLRERGELFRKFCTADRDNRMYEYSGDAIFDKQGFRGVQSTSDVDSDDDGGFRRLQHGDVYIPARVSQTTLPLTDSNVMVDYESYFRYGPDVSQIGDYPTSDDIYECLCPDCAHNDKQNAVFKPHYDNMTGAPDEKWEDFQLMLCPPRVLGYVLKDKQWAQLTVNQLKSIKEESYTQVMQRLHLSGRNSGEEKKELVFGLVKNHGMVGTKLNDLVAEKGKGLVFLLYGAPGVGKTSTAQMVARAARKSLFSIGVADVGTKARQVESNLETIFDLATTWRAILLIDEADVFLQSRSSNVVGPSAEGSALVSVFLRVLEYYRGILFLTTNQIAQFDVAVQSRVHIALKYERLDESQTYKIFMGFVDQYNEDRAVDRADYEKLKRFAQRDLYRKEFDGRQIRNIVACAMGYARGQGESQMNLEHILHVVGYVEDFQKDLAGQMKSWRDQQRATRV